MRTSIVINDALLRKAMDVSGLKTKKDVVDRALQEFAALHSRRDLSELKGKIKFSEGYEYKILREGR